MASALKVSFVGEKTTERDFLEKVFGLLKTTRKIETEVVESQSKSVTVLPTSADSIESLATLSSALAESKHAKESEALQNVISKCLEKKEYGGLALSHNTTLTDADHESVLFLVSAWLESVNSQEKAREFLPPLAVRSSGTRPMTLAEKIFAHHAIGGTAVEGLATGNLARIAVDWVMASEASWFVRCTCLDPPRIPSSPSAGYETDI